MKTTYRISEYLLFEISIENFFTTLRRDMPLIDSLRHYSNDDCKADVVTRNRLGGTTVTGF